MLWQTERVGAADMTPNQSLAGLLARLYDSIETPGLLWLAFSVLVLALGLSRAASARADGDELTAFTLVGLTANVISPISWTHHLVWVIPAIIVLADAAVRRREASRGLPQRASQGPVVRRPARGQRAAPADLVPDADRAAPRRRRARALPALPDLADLAVRAPTARGVALPGRPVRRADGELAGARADRAGRRAALAAGRGAGVLRATGSPAPPLLGQRPPLSRLRGS